MNDNEKAFVRQLGQRLVGTEKKLDQVLQKYQELITACENQPRSISQEIDSIPGRRIFYTLSKRVSFTAAQNGLAGQPLVYTISQDGPFIATHYPMMIWKPNAPSTATNFGFWSPVSSWPLPTQEVANQDRIDVSYFVMDSGSQRNFNNEMLPPVLSRPDNLIPLPVPTLFSPNSVINITPLYERIFFNPQTGVQGAVPTTGGELVCAIPGYRIVNM